MYHLLHETGLTLACSKAHSAMSLSCKLQHDAAKMSVSMLYLRRNLRNIKMGPALVFLLLDGYAISQHPEVKHQAYSTGEQVLIVNGDDVAWLPCWFTKLECDWSLHQIEFHQQFHQMFCMALLSKKQVTGVIGNVICSFYRLLVIKLDCSRVWNAKPLNA